MIYVLFLQIGCLNNISQILIKEMILSSQKHEVKMAKKYKRILHLYPTFRQTYLFLGQKHSRQDCVVHIDLRGQILFEFTFEHPIESIGLITDRDVIALQTRQNKIVLINLQSYCIKRLPHYFMNVQTDQSSIITFAESQLVCIEQKGRYKDNRYKLTYYQYLSLISCAAKPISVFQSKDNIWTAEYVTSKSNNKSTVCWFMPLERQAIIFNSYKIESLSHKGLFQTHKIKLSKVALTLNHEVTRSGKLQIGVTHVWQIQPGIFLIVCLTNSGNYQLKLPFTRYLIFDSVLKRMRQALFSFSWQQDYMMHYLNLGRRGVFITFGEEEDRVVESKIFYVDFHSESILGEEVWRCGNQTYFQMPGYDQQLICESKHQIIDIQKVQMVNKRLLSPKELYIHVMVQYYPDIDDDLILEVTRVLHYSKQSD